MTIEVITQIINGPLHGKHYSYYVTLPEMAVDGEMFNALLAQSIDPNSADSVSSILDNFRVVEIEGQSAGEWFLENLVRYEARLVPKSSTTAHSAPLRWDGEKFREGFGFDAELFDTRNQAREILRGHSAPGFHALAFPIQPVSA